MMANKFIDASLTLCTDPARIDPGLTGNGTNKLGIFKRRMVVLKIRSDSVVARRNGLRKRGVKFKIAFQF